MNKIKWFVVLGLSLCTLSACYGKPTPVNPTTLPATASSVVQPVLTPGQTEILAALSSQSQFFRFSHLPPTAGLSQSVVTAILQDQQGFLWLGTQDGLNRYDGQSFKVFKTNLGTDDGLAGNLVTGVAEDQNGVLWIGTSDGGLSAYYPQLGKFRSYLNDPQNMKSISENSITGLGIDSEGFVWAGTSNAGLNRLDPKTGEVRRFAHNSNDPATLSSNQISKVLVDNFGNVWVGTIGGGLNQLPAGSEAFIHYRYISGDENSLSEDFVQSLFMDQEGILWVGTFTSGLNRLDSRSGSIERYASIQGNPEELSSSSVSAIFEDNQGRLWIGTQGAGACILERGAGTFTCMQNSQINSDSISSNTIMSIYEDEAGILWFGTFGTGLDFYDPQKFKFLHLSADPEHPERLTSNSIWAITQDQQGTLWIGTNEHGATSFDWRTRQWKHYENDPADPNSIQSNTVFLVYEDRQGTLWFATPVGLSRFDPQKPGFSNYALPFILSIFEDGQGNFWLGSTSGLILFDRQTGSTQYFDHDPNDPFSLSSSTISLIYEDRSQRFWIGTMNAGLNLFDRQTMQATRYVRESQNPESISSNAVMSVLEDKEGRLWFGTSDGLNRLDPLTGSFISYHEKDGLPNGVIYGILEDDSGNLWLSTNAGLSRFTLETLSFKNFDTSDGLQAAEFNQFSHYRSPEGILYFGGVGGMNIFVPSQIQENPYIPPVVITNFRLFNEIVEPASGAPIEKPIEYTSEIRLNHTDDFFEFDFAALHFSSPEEIQYAYIMENFDKDWNWVGNRPFATYTRVPPGNYVFRVKATNSDGVWNEDGTAILITIPPPFWQTLWFRMLMGTVLLGIISGGFLWRIRSIDSQRRHLEDLVQKRTQSLSEAMIDLEKARDAAEAANHAKSTFLTNMSHEFRTPLNAILGFTQLLLRNQSLDAAQRDDIKVIMTSSNHLLGLINDVLDMSKIEAGRATLALRGFDLAHLLEGLEEMFALRAAQKDIGLSLRISPAVPAYVKGDEGKLRQVLMNLLGNAVKFTESGEITLSVEAEPGSQPDENLVRFTITDTGSGIAADEISSLFVPFVQTQTGNETQGGTGLGLPISQQYVRLMGGEIQVESHPGRGSTFWFDIPLEVVEVSDLARPPATHRAIGLEPGQPAFRLLLVDDQKVNRQLLRRIFIPLGFEVREAENGSMALEAWEAWEPHLIFMDMRMPVMDGFEATRRIKATTRGMATIIIALTASALEEDREIILSEGCDDYIRKPFQELDLIQVIEKHLGARFIYERLDASETARTDDSELPSVSLDAELRAEWQSQRNQIGELWLEKLEGAVILGDQIEIEECAAEIDSALPQLAARIIQLGRSYEHEHILALIEQLRKIS